MKIRYAGPKPIKLVNVAGKDFTFDPLCEFNEIFDLEIIKWLLHPDRAGLFVVEETKDPTPSQMHPETTQVKAETLKTEKTGKDTPKRGRPKKRG